MATRISGRNKIFIGVFIILIVLILGILIVSVTLSRNESETIDYNIESTSVLFNSDTNLVDVTNGGKIEKRWDGKYYFIQNESDIASDLGSNPVVYNPDTDTLDIFGGVHRVFANGDVTKKSNKTSISLEEESSFYKIADRIYLVVADEIKSQDGSIYANKYVIVYIDKQGNASLLNDVLNIKTINPMILKYGDYSFDVANEALKIGETTVDLKMINGSSNEYVAKVEDPQKAEMETLIGSYNQLVSDFTEYVENNQSTGSSSGGVTVIDGTSSNTASGGTTSGGTTSGGTTSGGTTSGGTTSGGTTSGSTGSNTGDIAVAANSTNLEKRISLRGAVAYPTYIDVTYIVTDPENKYQVVYLLVTGWIDGKNQTVKIFLDKYITGYRITGLSPKNEYSISMGRVAIEIDEVGERSLDDAIEDVINVRTTDSSMKISLEKISGGKVYFNFKATNEFAVSSGNIVLYADDTKVGEVEIDYRKSLSDDGFSTSLDLVQEAEIYMLKLENAIYADSAIDVNLYRKFVVN